MTYETEMNYILELLRCAVTDDIPSVAPEHIDWDIVFRFALKHRICSTLYFGIQKLPQNQQQAIKHYEQYLLEYKKTLVKDANRAYQLELLRNEFEKINIDYIFLKGSVTKYLYPDTSMRVMNDIDIFFRGTDFNTISEIFFRLGYNVLKKDPKETSYFNPAHEIRIEMQTQLMDEGYETWFHYLENIWDKCITSENSHEYKMTDEDFYLYHIIHMAKHFKNGGIGLTHIMDVWIMRNAYTDLNYEYVHKELKTLGLDVFEDNLRLLVSYWFGNDKPDKETLRTLELLGSYLFYGGAFGVKTQKEANAVAARNDTKISWRKKIFPDKNTMVNYYGSILKKHSWLIPFYWIRLNFKRIFKGHKNLKNNITTMRSISDEDLERTRELMKRCGM